MASADEQLDVVVVGAGVAGLACARQLHDAGLRVCVVEATHHTGAQARSPSRRVRRSYWHRWHLRARALLQRRGLNQ